MSRKLEAIVLAAAILAAWIAAGPCGDCFGRLKSGDACCCPGMARATEHPAASASTATCCVAPEPPRAPASEATAHRAPSKPLEVSMAVPPEDGSADRSPTDARGWHVPLGLGEFPPSIFLLDCSLLL